MQETLNFIGCGKMGSAIINGLLEKSPNIYTINVYDEYINAQENLGDNLADVNWLDESIFNHQGVFIVCTKPNIVKEVVAKISQENLIISIAAGISLDSIDQARLKKGATIRVMPNTPFLIGKGVSALCGNTSVKDSDKTLAMSIFSVASSTFWLEHESKIDVITGLSGSGPAYIFLMIQSLEDSAVHLGLDRVVARKIAIETTLGSAMLASHAFEATGRSSQDLINDVTSPGGTTIEGIVTLKENGFETAVHKAVASATKRAKELGQ